ncbi:MAG: hypothetical protein QOJ14_1498 [Thermoleophilaceae bacterium]|jgi:hypothetical protein|nr:hypothetical protein [Thermoleophilaceae bacterium]
MHENAARALQYYEDLPRRSGRPDLRLVDGEPRTRRREEADHAAHEETAYAVRGEAEETGREATEYAVRADAFREDTAPRETGAPGPEIHTITLDPRPAEPRRRAEPRRPRASAPHRGPEAARQRGPILPARHRQAVAPRIAGRPDRVAMWAVLLGFFLTAVAAATGHG